MATRIFGLLAASAGVFLFGTAAAAAKLNVCHIPPGNPDNFHTIVVDAKALRSHLAHGDLAGRCGDFCDTLCDDGNDCTVDACDQAEKCIRPPEAADDGTGCDDGNACTTADACGGGACIGGPPPLCEDGDLCTAASCDSGTGCVFTPLPDSDADAVCDAIDNCPFVVNPMQENNDALPAGDACQCGDIDLSGVVDAADVVAARQNLVGARLVGSFDLARCNVVGPSDGGTSDCGVDDIFLMERFTAGLPAAIENVCDAYGP